MKMARYVVLAISFLFLHSWCTGQRIDTIPPGPQGKKHRIESPYKIDSLAKHKHNPHKATLYSTFFPGLGQIYNRKYWKVPLVWAAVGIPTYTYFYNRSWYQKCQTAIGIIVKYQTLNVKVPDSEYRRVDPKLQTFLTSGDANSLRNYRNQYRKDEDYSVLFVILFWGLNIVDATVDAHLASFDVGNDLSFRLAQPSPNAMVPGPMGTGMGLSLLVDLHKPRYRPLPVVP